LCNSKTKKTLTNRHKLAVFLCSKGGVMPPQEEADLRSQLAVMNTQIEGLTKTVDALTEEVKILTALANQGRGSLRTLLIIGGIWTGVVAFLSFAAGHLTWK
jgi:hypothetical protein